MRQYLVSEQILQATLNALGKCKIDLPLADLVALVDEIRSLQPVAQANGGDSEATPEAPSQTA